MLFKKKVWKFQIVVQTKYKEGELIKPKNVLFKKKTFCLFYLNPKHTFTEAFLMHWVVVIGSINVYGFTVINMIHKTNTVQQFVRLSLRVLRIFFLRVLVCSSRDLSYFFLEIGFFIFWECFSSANDMKMFRFGNSESVINNILK